MKSYNKWGLIWWLDALFYLVASISGLLAALFLTLFVAIPSMYDATGIEDFPTEDVIQEVQYGWPSWGVYMENKDAVIDFGFQLGMWTVIAGAVCLAALIGIWVLTGRFNRCLDGTIKLNWLDKIWSEVHIILLCLTIFGAGACGVPIYNIVPCENWFDLYKPGVATNRLYEIDNVLVIKMCLLGMLVLIILSIIIFTAIVKKLKAKKYWRHSMFGSLFVYACRGMDNLSKLTDGHNKIIRNYVIILIGMVILAMTWVGAIADVILIFMFVPKKVQKFLEIRKGVKEVKNGNLTYKIHVDVDFKGPKSDLDFLAQDINDISQATNIAIQNELKNQRMKTELISNVSHDIKTPLTSMITYLDLIKTEGLDSDNVESYFRIIDEKTHRLKALTDNLFEAAKASSGNIPVSMEEIDLEAIINQSLGEMSSRLAEKNLDIIVEKKCESCKVKADGQLLWRVIENLLGNISKYALPDSRVYISLREPSKLDLVTLCKADKKDRTLNDMELEDMLYSKKCTLIEIKNISEEKLNISSEELMERFKRGDEARSTEGSGLGLSIAKDLTTIMGGAFDINIDGDLFKAQVLLETA